MSLLGDALRTAQIQVDGVTVPLHMPGRLQQLVRIVGAELHDQWPVHGWVTIEIHLFSCPLFLTLLLPISHVGSTRPRRLKRTLSILAILRE